MNTVNLDRTIFWIGDVNDENTDKVIAKIVELHKKESGKEIYLHLTSCGGGGMGFAFYDFIRASKIRLHIIGSGYVDSMAVIILLSGTKRSLTPHTSLFLHGTRRTFQEKACLTNEELVAFQQDNNFANKAYKDIVRRETHGKLPKKELDKMMLYNRSLSATEAVRMGLADDILKTF